MTKTEGDSETMPSSKNYVRDYKQERKTAIARGETGVGSNSGDAVRHRARRKKIKHLKKTGKAHTAIGRDIDHKTPLRGGGTNALSNLRVRGVSANRSDNGQRKK